MKKSTYLLIAFLAAGILRMPSQAHAAAYIVADAVTGYVLESSHASDKMLPGNLVKVATAVVTLDWAKDHSANLDQIIAIPQSAFVSGAGNSVGFVPGDRVSIRDLIFTMLLRSDDVAAETLAIYVGSHLPGDRKVPPSYRFIAQMNALARSLHMGNTRFINAYGLNNEKGKPPTTTAADMARLARYAITKPAFMFFVSQKSRSIKVTRADNTSLAYNLTNSNELLGQADIDGMKTGSTVRAGECEIISSSRQPESAKQPNGSHVVTPRRLVVVVLHTERGKFSQALDLVKDGWLRYNQWAGAGRPIHDGDKL